MTNENLQQFYLYDETTDKFLVEFVLGGFDWLEEGELDTVPRVWTFTESEIIEKFGADHLKYKKTIEEIDRLRNRQTESSDTKMFYQIDGKYYRSFENAKKKVIRDIEKWVSNDDLKKFVSDELDKLESIDSLKESIIKQFDRSRVTIYSSWLDKSINIEIYQNWSHYASSIVALIVED